MRIVAVVTGTDVVRVLVTTASRTPTPPSTDRVSTATRATMTAPTTVPGTRPSISRPTARRSTPWGSRRTIATASGTTSSIGVAGIAAGWRIARTGTTTRLAPKPTVPCTAEPMTTIASATAKAAGARWRTSTMGSPACPVDRRSRHTGSPAGDELAGAQRRAATIAAKRSRIGSTSSRGADGRSNTVSVTPRPS